MEVEGVDVDKVFVCEANVRESKGGEMETKEFRESPLYTPGNYLFVSVAFHHKLHPSALDNTRLRARPLVFIASIS